VAKTISRPTEISFHQANSSALTQPPCGEVGAIDLSLKAQLLGRGTLVTQDDRRQAFRRRWRTSWGAAGWSACRGLPPAARKRSARTEEEQALPVHAEHGNLPVLRTSLPTSDSCRSGAAELPRRAREFLRPVDAAQLMRRWVLLMPSLR
jgi:hypothetical protein